MSLTSWFLSIEDFQKSDWFTGWIAAPPVPQLYFRVAKRNPETRAQAGRQTVFDWQLSQPA
jgi:hypothetical protein